MFFESTLAYADSPAPAGPQPSFFEGMMPILVIVGIMYFFMIRPQAKKQREHADLLNNLKNGDEVITTGGLIGHVRSIADGFVVLDTGSSTIKILKDHVSGLSRAVVPKANPKATRTKRGGAQKA